jgi:NAD+ kinase
VVWPEVEALLLVPISAHALFAGPMVVSPDSVLAVEVISGSGDAPRPSPDTRQNEAFAGVLWCDGRRRVDLPPGSRVEVRRGSEPVLLARLRGVEGSVAGGAPFTDRLVAKFGLPVAGWRGLRPGGRDGNEQRRTQQDRTELNGNEQDSKTRDGSERSRQHQDREQEPRAHA